MSFSALGRLQNNKIAHLQPKFTMCVSLNMYQFKIFTPVTRNQSCWDSDITQKNSIWLSFCSFRGPTTKTSPKQAKVAFNFKTVLLHRKTWVSLPFWQIQSNLSQIRWLSQTQSHMLKYIWDNIVWVEEAIKNYFVQDWVSPCSPSNLIIWFCTGDSKLCMVLK